MYVLNTSNIIKKIKIGNLSLSFPMGVSEHPEIPKVMKYVTSHPDLSIFNGEVVRREVIKKEIPIAKSKDEDEKKLSKKSKVKKKKNFE